MAQWFAPYAVVVVLMLSSFLCFGMAALWAGTSRRHLLARAAVVALLPTPLLMRQAYEVYAVFTIQSLIVICGAAIYCRAAASTDTGQARGDWDTQKSRAPLLRFSLSTLLIVTAAIAVCLTAAIQLPRWENLAWRTVVISGFGAAVGTLAGAWLYVSRRKWVTWPVACLACVAVGTAVSKLDWFFEATLQMAGWPPRPISPASFMGSPANYDEFDAWSFIPLSIALATAMLIFLWRAAADGGSWQLSNGQYSLRRPFARAAFAALALVIGGIPLATMISLLVPAPLPQVAMPIPNAHDDFQKAAEVAHAMKLDYVWEIDDARLDNLLPLAADADRVDAIVKAGLEKTCYVPMNYFSPKPSLSNDQTDGYYRIEIVLTAKGRLAESADHYDQAVDAYLRATQFGFAACRGAMVWEGALIRGRAAFGTRGLYAIREELSSRQLAHCIERLPHIDASDEPMDDVLDRYRVWAERRNGWHGHLKYLLETIAVEDGSSLSTDYWHRETFKNHYRRSHAVTRLLICELALMRYHQEIGRWPKTLDALVPNYLPKVPSDPFDPHAAPLRYRLTDTGYLLYSVSQNGVDNGGIAWQAGEKIPGTTGDLRLDRAFER